MNNYLAEPKCKWRRIICRRKYYQQEKFHTNTKPNIEVYITTTNNTTHQNKQDEVISLILNIINIGLSANFGQFLHDFVQRLIDRNAKNVQNFHLEKLKTQNL